jgi:hypothetical protein
MAEYHLSCEILKTQIKSYFLHKRKQNNNIIWIACIRNPPQKFFTATLSLKVHPEYAYHMYIRQVFSPHLDSGIDWWTM